MPNQAKIVILMTKKTLARSKQNLAKLFISFRRRITYKSRDLLIIQNLFTPSSFIKTKTRLHWFFEPEKKCKVCLSTFALPKVIFNQLSLLKIIISIFFGLKMKGQDTKTSMSRKNQKEISIKGGLERDQQKNIPSFLKKTILFDAQDPAQNFYRQITSTQHNDRQAIRLGWRIAQIGREQEDLTLYCLALLHSSVNLPIAFFTRNQAVSKKNTYAKYLWLQGIILTCKNNQEEQHKQSFEAAFYHFIKENVVDLFKSFIEHQISWQVLTQKRFSQEEIVRKFKEELIVSLMILFQKFHERIGLMVKKGKQHNKRQHKKG